MLRSIFPLRQIARTSSVGPVRRLTRGAFVVLGIVVGMIATTSPALAGPRLVTVFDSGFSIDHVRIGQGGTVLWNVDSSDAQAHGIVDLTGIGVLGTRDPIPPGGSYSVSLVAAGKYPVGDSVSGDIMSVNVGMTSTQVSGDTYRIQWATNIVPSCFFRVRFRPPGGDWQLLLKHVNSYGTTLWRPTGGSGTYSFEARLIRQGRPQKSGWSNPLDIIV
jgi:hypothetical protein